jgi:hypothetical protein
MNILSIFKRKPKYRRLELKCFSWSEGDKKIRENYGKPESEQWHLAKEEDTNKAIGTVYLERRVTIKKK